MKKKAKKKALKKKSGKKRPAKKKAVKKAVRRAAPKPVKKEKPIGTVTHFYTHIKVAIVKFNTKVKVGSALHYKGATTDFTETATSMQFDHAPVKFAQPKKQIGIKVKKRVRPGDLVYKG